MIQIQLPSGCYLLLNVHENATKPHTSMGGTFLVYHIPAGEKGYDFWDQVNVKLSPGQWSIIGKADELKGEGWVYLVGENNMKPETTLILKKIQP